MDAVSFSNRKESGTRLPERGYKFTPFNCISVYLAKCAVGFITVMAVHKSTPGRLIIFEQLTVVFLAVLAFDGGVVTCGSVVPQKLSGVDKHNPKRNSESEVSALAAAAQRDERGDNLSRPEHTLPPESSGPFVSQSQQHSLRVGWVAEASRQQSVSTEKYSNFRTSGPYLVHWKSAISHAVTRELKESSRSEQEPIKEDIPSDETTFLLEKGTGSGERHSKFESGSRELSEKVLIPPPFDRKLSEANNSFHYEQRLFNESVNISFPNITSTNSAQEYRSQYTPGFYEDKFDAGHETFLPSDKFIRNCPCNLSSFAEGNSHHVDANKLWNKTTSLEKLLRPSENETIRVIKRTPGTNNEGSRQQEHGPDLNVSSEMNYDVITTVNTNSLDINVPSSSNMPENIRSLASAETEVDRKPLPISVLINAELRDGEMSKSSLHTENVMHLDGNNVSSTREVSNVAQATELAELSLRAVSSKIQDGEPRTHNVETTEDRNDLGSGTGKSISYEEVYSDADGTRVDTGGRNIFEETGRGSFKDKKGENDFVFNADTVTSISSTTPEQDSGENETFVLGSSVNVALKFIGAESFNDGSVASTERVTGGSHALVQEQNAGVSSEIHLNKDNLRAHRRRQISLSKLFKIIANESMLRSRQSNSSFVKHKLKDVNIRPINFPYVNYFINDSTKDVENFSLGSDVLQAQIAKPVVYFGNVLHRPRHNKTSHFRNSVSEGGDEVNITHLEDTKLHQNLSSELTEGAIKVVPTLTYELFPKSGNSMDRNYFKNISDDVTFNSNLLMNFITSTTSQSYTEDHNKNHNTSISESGEIASEVTEYLNSSEVHYEFAPEATVHNNVEVSTLHYSDVTVSTPKRHDKDVERWNTATNELLTSVPLPSYSVSGITEASVSDTSPTFSRNDSVPGWPVKLSAEVSGDLILGGLMMVHERQDNITCGPIMPQGGIQALETMLYTLDVLNKDKMIPNVTIGAHILDDCDKDTYGLEMAVDFIKGREIFRSILCDACLVQCFSKVLIWLHFCLY
jgi:hypothetical protein